MKSIKADRERHRYSSKMLQNTDLFLPLDEWDDRTLYQIRGSAQTMTLMSDHSLSGDPEPVLALTLVSGKKENGVRDGGAVHLSKTHLGKHVLQGLMAEDGKPFHVILTNLTTSGPLFVRLFLGEEKTSLNEINLLHAGESLVVDSHKVDGVARSLLATSHKTIVERVLDRSLTPREDERCRARLSNMEQALFLRVEVIPTLETAQVLYQPDSSYWTCLPYLVRKDRSAVNPRRLVRSSYVVEEADGGDSVSDEVDGNFGYLATIEFGEKVKDIPKGRRTRAELIHSKAIKDIKVLITIVPDLVPYIPRVQSSERLKRRYYLDQRRSKMSPAKPTKRCLLNPSEKPNTMLVPCGHICLNRSCDPWDIMFCLDPSCPFCGGEVNATIDCKYLDWI